YELGHLQLVAELFKKHENRDPAEILPETLPDPIPYESQRDFVRETLKQELDLSVARTKFVDRSEETEDTRRYRQTMNSEGSPTDTVAADYQWRPGTELTKDKAQAA
ncbi:MAG TPA: hypothetical protein VHG33_10450, partial [Woeseiaceae bacterium]|nr:hypothetical protein [Woeseiaceae bacterium]